MDGLKPFWRYYGGKWRAAPRYPKPRHCVIIEPFAGAAGYSCRYPDHDVVLIDRSPIIAGIWRYLVAVTSAEIRAIPTVEAVDDLPSWVPQEARWLVGFWLDACSARPGKNATAKLRAMAASGHGKVIMWDTGARERIAVQIERIRHWHVIEGEYDTIDGEATWFIDPPYSGRAGKTYTEQPENFEVLGVWCQTRAGQVIVCENEGAAWLPFVPFAVLKSGPSRGWSREVIWSR